MLAEILQAQNPITLTFIAVIAVFTIGFHVKFNLATVQKAPSFLTTCGIFGTFIGIAYGLLQFEPSAVQKSVPALIDGIKTAFWASACGIGCALTIKGREIVFSVPRKITAQQSSGATIDDLAALLKSVQQAMVAVQQSLVGNDDSTLLSQMKLVRQDSNDRFDRLGRSLDDFCQKAAENNSKALMEALKDVIREFNDKITEQFGENFKQLNQAVGRTLEWQEKYREQISEMIEQQARASKSMHIATQQYSELVAKSEIFSQTAQSLSSLLASLEVQKTQLEQSLVALATLLESASKGLPSIEAHIMEMVRQIGDGVKNSHGEFSKLLLKSSQTSSQTVQQVGNSVMETIRQIGEGVKNSHREFRDLLLQSATASAQTVQQVGDSIKTANDEFKAVLLDVIRASNQEFNNHIRQIIDKTKEQIVILDNALSEELSKSLESLGRQLAALSEKFVADYSPLTDKLAEVMNIARRSSYVELR